MNNAFKSSGRLSWFLVESDSDDRTLDECAILSAHIPDFRYTSAGSLQASMPKRTERIAYCRNLYLKEIAENEEYHCIDYVVVVDLDGMCALLSEDGVKSCFERSDWDVCAANQKGPYYDIWALRHSEWCPSDWSKENKFLVEHGVSRERAIMSSLYARMVTIQPNAEWIEVDSAFGGLAIYRYKALQEVLYSGLDECGKEICEHVTLHQQIRSKGMHIYINPRLINSGITEHSKEKLIRYQLKRRYHDALHRLRRMLNA